NAFTVSAVAKRAGFRAKGDNTRPSAIISWRRQGSVNPRMPAQTGGSIAGAVMSARLRGLLAHWRQRRRRVLGLLRLRLGRRVAARGGGRAAGVLHGCRFRRRRVLRGCRLRRWRVLRPRLGGGRFLLLRAG